MNESTRFWGQFLGAYLSDEDPASSIDAVSDWSSVRQRGEESHLLELIDVFLGGEVTPEDVEWPGSLRTAARKSRTLTVHRNSLFRDLIEEIDRTGASTDVRYAWLKGATRLRENNLPTGGRRLSDLDLLVHPADLGSCHEVLDRLGYEAHRHPGWITSEQFSQSVASTFYTREYRGMKVLIDLHWHLTDYPARRYCGQWDFSLEPVWERVTDRTMAPEHRLIYLIDHAFTHNFTYLKFLPDLHNLIATHELDWEFVNREAQRMNLSFVLRLFSSFSSVFFPAEAKPETMESLEGQSSQWPDLSDFEGEYLKRSLNNDCAESDYLRVSLRRLPTLRQKVAFLRYILFPPVEAVPMVRSDSDVFQTARLYLERLGRVLRRALLQFV